MLRAAGLGVVGDVVGRTEAHLRTRRAERDWSSAVARALDSEQRPVVVVGALALEAIPVIVCLWARPDRLPAVLDLLSTQNSTRPVRLILWNNRPENSARYLAELSHRRATSSLASVEFVDSAHNIGGLARFIVARHLLLDGYRGAFITLDDDLDITDSFVDDLLGAYAANRIAGWWAFRSGDEYWDRVDAQPGEQATYVGTGGAVFDSSIVSDRGFFTRLPTRYGFLEDMWACAWVLARGGELRKADTLITMVQEELNQHHGLIGLKPQFQAYLRAHPPVERGKAF